MFGCDASNAAMTLSVCPFRYSLPHQAKRNVTCPLSPEPPGAPQPVARRDRARAAAPNWKLRRLTTGIVIDFPSGWLLPAVAAPLPKTDGPRNRFLIDGAIVSRIRCPRQELSVNAFPSCFTACPTGSLRGSQRSRSAEARAV